MHYRILEPEVMDTEAEARDYNAMDHREVNERFVEDLLAVLASAQRLERTDCTKRLRVLDVGTGTALIPIELCRRDDRVHVTGIDLSRWMLELGRQNITAAGLEDRIRLDRVDAKTMPFHAGAFELVVSNSIVHHIAEPLVVLSEMGRVTARGGLLFVRDLLRPPDEATLRQLVATYAAEANEHQRSLFAASLRAALTVDEMRLYVSRLGFPKEGVEQTSDRHWTWVCRPK